VRKLVSRVISERVVLLYAASGAGKTSLLNAGVAPRLSDLEEFEIFPATRVRHAEEPPPGSRNVFVASVLMNWTSELATARLLDRGIGVQRKATTRDASERPGTASLVEFLADREHPKTAEGFPAPRIIIFDQLEELFTAYPEHWADRAGFFDEVAAAVGDDSLLHVILALREDFLAELDPYADAVPGGLRARFRLERLGAEAAHRAVTGPLEATTRRFAPGVAELLVDDLLTFRIDTGSERSREVLGEFVEPVQLQVSCQDLWSSLPADVEEITADHLEEFAVVDTALSRFYVNAIAAAAKRAQMDASDLSHRFEEVFITPMETRGTVLRAAASTGGIPNEAIDELERRHLVRPEWSRGARWYELTHDRMIDPIRERNRSLLSSPAGPPTEEYDLIRQASSALARAEELRVSGHLEDALVWAERSRDDYERTSTGRAGVADALMKQGEILFETGRFDEANDRVRTAQPIYAELQDPTAEADAFRAAGVVERARGNADAAADAFIRALEQYLTTENLQPAVRVLDLLGQLYSDLGDFDRADESTRESIRLANEIGDREGEANARTTRAFLFFHRGDHDAAINDTQAALAIFSELEDRAAMAILVGNLGYVHSLRGDVDEALRWWTRALALYRELGDHEAANNVLIALADAELDRGEHRAAAELLREGLRFRPEDLRLLARRASVNWYAGRYEEAIADFNAVLEAEPSTGEAYSGRGQIFAAQSRYEEALDDLDRALELLDPDSDEAAYARAARGFALAGRGDLDAGLTELARSIEARPENAWAYYRRALVYEQAGDLVSAAQDATRSLRADSPRLTPAMADEARAMLARIGVGPRQAKRRWLGRVGPRS
jgi:tetratricopeptide (TPR) repeat protein